MEGFIIFSRRGLRQAAWGSRVGKFRGSPAWVLWAGGRFKVQDLNGSQHGIYRAWFVKTERRVPFIR